MSSRNPPEADGWACARHLGSGSVRNRDDVLGRFVAETHPLDHGETVFLAQVARNLHRQRAAVFMTKPLADGGNVHAGLDARCREEMAKVMVGEVQESKFPAGGEQTFFSIFDWADEIGG